MMNVISKEFNYPETKYVAMSKGDYLQIDMIAAGYTVDDLTIEARENGVLIIGKPKKTVGEGELLKGFSNFFDFHNPEKFDRKEVKAELYNGILTVKVPVVEKYRTVKVKVIQAAPIN